MIDRGTIPILKVSPLEVHDRLQSVKRDQSENIADVVRMFIEKDPFDGIPFYLFSHARKHEDGSSTRVVWQPRLKKPIAQTNSMLFKLDPRKKDQVVVVWMIPERHKWHLYEKGKMFENQTVIESVHAFQNNREEMEADDPLDLSDWEAQCVLQKLYPNLFKDKECTWTKTHE